jgi:hypothetical protein
MQRKTAVLAVMVFFCLASSAFAESLVEKITKIGFPEKVAISLAQLAETQNFSEKIDIPKGMSVSAIIRNGEVANNVDLDWEGGFQFKAEKYETEGFSLYRFKNLGNEILFRIGDLPRPIPEISLPLIPPKEEPKIPIPVQKSENRVEEVYEAAALPLNLKELGDQPMAAIVVPIYQTNWIGDGLGKYVVTEKDGKEVEKLLVRKVWRAYVGSEMFPAVITKFGTNLFVVAQGKTKQDLMDKNIVIISGSGKFALTLSGMAEFDIQKFEESEEYRSAFFEKNPSKVKEEMLVNISPDTENGRAFIGDLRKMFPNNYFVKGRLISTETDSETLKALVGSSNNANYMRRVVEKGGLPSISLGSVMCPPCELARMLIVWSLAAFDETLSGNFLEAKVSGYQAAQAMAPYLAEFQEELNYLSQKNK